MTDTSLNKPETPAPHSDDLDKLNNILAERLTFDPFSVDDDTLWKIVSERENAKLHNYHCMIVRFGEIYSVYDNTPYASNRIKIYYGDKMGSKNVNDFRFTIYIEKNKKACNEIINPFVCYDCKKGLLGKDLDLTELLENKQFFLMHSKVGLNKFNITKFVWELVLLCDDLSTNAKILREYTLRAQVHAYREILKSSQNFGINLPLKNIRQIIKPLLSKVGSLIYLHSLNDTGIFIEKIDNQPITD